MVAGRNRYVRNNKGFDALATSPKVKRFANTIGEHWAGELRQMAPRSSGKGPHYQDNIVVETDIVELIEDGRRVPRWAAFIIAAVPHARRLEVGTPRMQNPPRPLSHLLDRIDAEDPNKVKQAGRKKLREG